MGILFTTPTCFADTPIQEDFMFEVISEEDSTCEISGMIPNGYDGILVIPEICTSYTGNESHSYRVIGIGDYAFYYMEMSLNSVQLPNSITYIGAHAFERCTALSTINIPYGVTAIRDGAFADCLVLQTDIPNSVVTIGKEAFCSCASFTSIDIPNSVTTIGDWAFDGCYNTKVLTIGSNVSTIGDHAFTNLSLLEEIRVLSPTPPMIQANTFDDYTVPLYVPIGAAPAYQSTPYWANFDIKESDFTGIGATREDAITVSTNGNEIHLHGIENGTSPLVMVHNTKGQLIYSGTDTTIKTPGRGLYIVTVANQTFKVCL